MRNHSLHVFDVFLLSMIMLKIDPLTLELLSNVDLKWNFRECVTRVSPRLHQPVSNRSDRQINDRNNGACSHNTLLDSAAGLFGTRHFRHGEDATKVPLKQDTCKFLSYSGYQVHLTRRRSLVRALSETNFLTIDCTIRNPSFITILFSKEFFHILRLS